VSETQNAELAPPQVFNALKARPILKPDDRQVWTNVRETDCRTALSRGLRHYLSQASIDWFDGKTYQFINVFESWAEPEDPAEFPSLAIVAATDAQYDADRLGSPSIIKLEAQQEEEPTPARYIKISSEMVQEFELCIWATSPNERAALVAIVEDMLEPVDWMTGVRLELPFYFNSRATYEKLSVVYDDNEADAQRRWRQAIISLTATLSQIVPLGKLPYFRPQPRVEVVVEGADC
jgi:hypothetical protein